MLFCALSLGAGPVARELLSQGIDFSGISIAVSAPEEDPTGELIHQLTGRMEDIRQYCTFLSLPREDAEEALLAGEVTAVLVLPENFIHGVLNGENPDLELIVSADRPLESLLTWWVGQSAADLLSAAQRGIYGVLDAWEPELDISFDQVKTDINLRYITRTLDRQSMFRQRQLRAVDSMELEEHYGLSLLVFLAMTLAPLLRPAFLGEGLALRRRLWVLGHRAVSQYGSSLAACCGVIFLIALLPGGIAAGWNIPGLVLLALFSGCFGSFCCLAGRSAAGCGWLGVILGGGALFLAGGILPTPLLPAPLQTLGASSPVGLLRSLLHLPLGQWQAGSLLGVLLWSAAFALAAGILYGKLLREEAPV